MIRCREQLTAEPKTKDPETATRVLMTSTAVAGEDVCRKLSAAVSNKLSGVLVSSMSSLLLPISLWISASIVEAMDLNLSGVKFKVNQVNGQLKAYLGFNFNRGQGFILSTPQVMTVKVTLWQALRGQRSVPSSSNYIEHPMASTERPI
ncbi:hypothetical protein R6Q59_003163 [Mikania micrantha]